MFITWKSYEKIVRGLTIHFLRSVVVVIAILSVGCDDDDGYEAVLEFLSPAPNSVVENTFIVEVDAPDRITEISLFLDNVLIGQADKRPFRFTVNSAGFSLGTYTLRADGYANAKKYGSKEISITIAKPTIEKPLEFTASKGRHGNKIALNWNKSLGATNYEIFKKSKPSEPFVKIGDVSTNYFEDTVIEETLVQYFYKVRAFNSILEYSEFSEHDYGYSSGKPYDLIRSFGKEGTSLDEFGLIVHIAYNNNELFVADDYLQRIVRYDKEGNVIGLFQAYPGYPIAPYFFQDKMLNTYNNIVSVQTGATVIKSIYTNLVGVRQVTVDDENYIYVTASNSHKIAKYDMNGNLILEWGIYGDLPGQVNAPWGIVFYQDKIVVSNYYSNKVQFFSKNGEFIKEWQFDTTTHDLYVKDNFLYIACGSYVAKTDYEGLVIEKISGDFSLATSIAIDEDENIFITDPYQRKIFVYRRSD